MCSVTDVKCQWHTSRKEFLSMWVWYEQNMWGMMSLHTSPRQEHVSPNKCWKWAGQSPSSHFHALLCNLYGFHLWGICNSKFKTLNPKFSLTANPKCFSLDGVQLSARLGEKSNMSPKYVIVPFHSTHEPVTRSCPPSPSSPCSLYPRDLIPHHPAPNPTPVALWPSPPLYSIAPGLSLVHFTLLLHVVSFPHQVCAGIAAQGRHCDLYIPCWMDVAFLTFLEV